MRAKCPGELLEAIYEICPWAIEPFYYHGSYTEWEHLTYQGFIFGMDSHSLIEVAHMLHWVRSTIVDGECWLMEPPRKNCPFNLMHEGWLGNLVQCFTHSVISQASVRRALISTFVMVFFIVGKRLTRRSSWPSPITSILFTFKGNVKVEGGSFLQCMVQLRL